MITTKNEITSEHYETVLIYDKIAENMLAEEVMEFIHIDEDGNMNLTVGKEYCKDLLDAFERAGNFECSAILIAIL
jgi:hypothetical protein